MTPLAKPYAACRWMIASGDVLLFRRNPASPLSRLICWWTSSVYSHAGVAVWLIIGDAERLFVLEAAWPLVRIYPLSLYLRKRREHIDWYAAAPQVHRESVAAYALSRVGYRYVEPGQLLLSFFGPLHWLARKLGRDVNKPLDKRRDFCSQLVADAIRHGLQNSEQLNLSVPVNTSPAMLEFCRYLRCMGTILPDSPVKEKQP